MKVAVASAAAVRAEWYQADIPTVGFFPEQDGNYTELTNTYVD
jgi:hypothetical protein